MTEDMSGVHCPEYGVVLPDEIAGLIERANGLIDDFPGYRPVFGEMIAALRALTQENERLKVGIAFGNDLLPALQQRIRELESENEQLRIDKITLGNCGCLPAYRSQ